MYLKRVEIANFRNLGNVSINPSAGIVTIYGKNGQGKTSFLEALYLVGNLKCVRTSRSAECIKWGSNISKIEVSGGGYIFNVEISTSGEKRKKINGKAVSTSEYLRKITILGFFPGEETKTFFYPKFMRELIDRGIFYIDRNYLRDYNRFRKLLSDRNVLLQSEEFDSNLFAAVDEEYRKITEEIEEKRRNFISLISDELATISDTLSGGEWKVSLKYFSSRPYNIEEEKKYGYSLHGPHRSRVEFTINGKEARKYASRGQIKIILLSYKLSIANLIEKRDDKPVFLIDDIGGELDEERRNYLLYFIRKKKIQAFVTSTSPLNESDENFIVREGRLWKQS